MLRPWILTFIDSTVKLICHKLNLPKILILSDPDANADILPNIQNVLYVQSTNVGDVEFMRYQLLEIIVIRDKMQ